MRSISWAAVPVLAAVILIAGCGGQKAPSELNNTEKQAFDSAPPEMKQIWLNGLEAVRTNDYATAQNLFYGLLGQDLSPVQKAAVSKESTIVMNTLYDGALKNDPAAVKALEELRRNPPMRQAR